MKFVKNNKMVQQPNKDNTTTPPMLEAFEKLIERLVDVAQQHTGKTPKDFNCVSWSEIDEKIESEIRTLMYSCIGEKPILEKATDRTGIEIIAEERDEQIRKHGFDSNHDKQHSNGQLFDAAIYVLTTDDSYFPKDWCDSFRAKLDEKEGIEALKVSGALIAAEIDRLNGEKVQLCYKSNEPCKHNCHGQCKESC